VSKLELVVIRDDLRRAWLRPLDEAGEAIGDANKAIPAPKDNGNLADPPSNVNPGENAQGCFLEDTQVLMSNGNYKDIEDIELGEGIVAYDLENGKAVNSNVTYTFVRNETKYRIIEYEVIGDE
jgi:hypothetical protein